MMMRNFALFASILLSATANFVESASLAFSPFYTDNVVLQRGVAASVAGTSSPGDVVTVSLSSNSNTKYTGTADANGNWRVLMAPQLASLTSQTLTASSSSSGQATLSNVLFGDVFVVAGEGNVLMSTSAIFNAADAIASADAYSSVLHVYQSSAPAPDVTLRAIDQGKNTHHQHHHQHVDGHGKKAHSHSVNIPLPRKLRSENIEAAASSILSSNGISGIPWTPISSSVVGGANWTAGTSAFAYLYGKHIIDSLGGPSSTSVPIGIMTVAAGGAPLQAFAGPQTWAQCPDGPAAARYSNSSLFTALLTPFAQAGTAIAGSIFWQGESNSAMAIADSTTAWFDCALPAFLTELRSPAVFNNSNLFIGVVQLPPLAAQFWTDAIPQMRQSQQNLNTSSNTAVIATCDTGDMTAEFTYLHSRAKDIVASRAANATLTYVYDSTSSPFWAASGATAVAGVENPTSNVTVVTLTFNESTLNALPLVIDASVVCPAGFPQGDPNNLWISYVCGAWRVRTDQTGGFKWYNADNAVIGPDGKSVLISVTLPAPKINVDALQYGYAPWSAAQLKDSNGNVVLPFEIPVSGPAGSAMMMMMQEKKTKEMEEEETLSFEGPEAVDRLITKLNAHKQNPTRLRGRALQAWMDLLPNQWTPLPLGTVKPAGWLATQLQVEVEGLVGSLINFYPPIAHSPWINITCPWPGGCQDTDDGEDFGY